MAAEAQQRSRRLPLRAAAAAAGQRMKPMPGPARARRGGKADTAAPPRPVEEPPAIVGKRGPTQQPTWAVFKDAEDCTPLLALEPAALLPPGWPAAAAGGGSSAAFLPPGSPAAAGGGGARAAKRANPPAKHAAIRP